MTRFPALLAALLLPFPVVAQDEGDRDDPFGLEEEAPIVGADETIAELASRAKPSLVVVTQQGRDGGVAGTGSGFVVSEDGLIATCAHVIGESREISVRFADGEEHEVTAIHAWDRKLDLAVLRIDKKGLQPLDIAEPGTLKQGADVIAMGNPQGFEFSVVRGVVSALREIDGLSLIQIAIPIEPGNSGGPLIDREGRVHGLLTMKSAVTDNLGFATPITALARLLDDPNTVPMDKWLTIGRLDPKRWKAIMGARWRQRAGTITAVRPGRGFGGRSLCISQRKAPEVPYEVAVEVKLDDESGAAGLVFESDGGDVHYGFYPSGGNLRLTRFEGPDVLSWTILSQERSPAYRRGEWNRLRVRVEADTITGFVNGERVVQLEDSVLRGGKAGLAKFRETEAEFRRFRLGADLAPDSAPADTLADLQERIEALAGEPGDEEAVAALAVEPAIAARLLKRRIEELRGAAEGLERAADRVHRRSVQAELLAELGKGEDMDLITAALLLAKHDNPELDVEAYHEEVERMAGEISAMVPEDAPPKAKVAAIARYLFEDNGYHGSRTDYYNRSNSYLNEVIDDREGIPITLSLLFIELSDHIDAGLRGLGLPGHFVVFYQDGDRRQLVDAFDGGKPLTDEEADQLVRDFRGQGRAADYPAAEPAEIVQRMLHNLKAIAIDEKEFRDAIGYVDLLLAIDPDDPQERLSRALLHVQTEQNEKAKGDLEWLFEKQPEGIHLDRLRELYNRL